MNGIHSLNIPNKHNLKNHLFSIHYRLAGRAIFHSHFAALHIARCSAVCKHILSLVAVIRYVKNKHIITYSLSHGGCHHSTRILHNFNRFGENIYSRHIPGDKCSIRWHCCVYEVCVCVCGMCFI